LRAAGWKPISLVDVKGKVTFTLWLCGCNLRCPFCHNWKLADNLGEVCSELNIDKMREELLSARRFIDFFHVTGGEPLLQVTELVELFKQVHGEGIKISLNSNLTLPWQLEKVLPFISHIATDLKPPSFYGYDDEVSSVILSNFLKSLDLLSKAGIEVELRVPVAKIPIEVYEELFRQVSPHVGFPHYFVFNKLLGPPLTQPRDEGWCESHCFSGLEEESGILDKLSKTFK